MALNGDQVRWVAHLARLEISEAEVAMFTEQLSNVVDYIEQLKEVDTEGIEPMAHALPINNVFREDAVTESLSAAAALANAPDRHGDFYSVPAVLD